MNFTPAYWNQPKLEPSVCAAVCAVDREVPGAHAKLLQFFVSPLEASVVRFMESKSPLHRIDPVRATFSSRVAICAFNLTAFYTFTDRYSL